MGTFGEIGTGVTWIVLGANENNVSKFTLSDSPVQVTKLSIYVKGTGGSGSTNTKGVIYADSGGEPDALLGATEVVALAYGEAEGWKDYGFASPVTLTSGDYWLGVINATGSIASAGCVNTGGTQAYAADTYADGPADPFPAHSHSTRLWSVYATYTPSTVGTGAFQTAGVTLSGAGHYDIIGTGALQIAGVTLSGVGHYDITGTGAFKIAGVTLSGNMWMDSAHLRHLGGRAMLWGAKGRAEILGLKGKASM